MASDTPTPIATTGSGTRCAAETPIKADIVLPPMIGQGCAKGLAGTANSSTAVAPIGATMRGMWSPSPNSQPLINPVSAMPKRAPKHAIRRSRNVAPARIGLNSWNPNMLPSRVGSSRAGVRTRLTDRAPEANGRPRDAVHQRLHAAQPRKDAWRPCIPPLHAIALPSQIPWTTTHLPFLHGAPLEAGNGSAGTSHVYAARHRSRASDSGVRPTLSGELDNLRSGGTHQGGT
jgi:hypothetical protein